MLIKNAKIVTFNENNDIIENGYVLIKDGIIKNIGENKELYREIKKLESGVEIYDAQGQILMPGFICTHTHIYSAFARGMDLKGGSTANFIEILENLWWRLDRKLTHEDIYYSALTTAIECIKSGVSCIFDHHAGANSIDGSLDVIEKALREVGLRGALCYELSDRDGDRAADEGIRENVRAIKKFKNEESDMIKALFGLHASFTLSDKTLERASIEGNALMAGFHVHVAEGRQDMEFSRSNFKKGVVERLDEYKIINDKTILAHCIHISEEEKELLKKGNVVHNPESNMNNAVGYCDALDLLKRGILVGLGSDGFSANPFRAMDTAYVLHKHQKQDPRVMTPNDVIKLGVTNNSRIASKFFNNNVGIIEENAKADLILIEYNSPTPANRENIAGHIIFGLSNSNVTSTMVNGKFVMKDKVLVNLDENAIYGKSREVANKFWERF